MINSTKDVLKNKDYLYNKLNFSEISFLNENGYCLIPPKKSFWEWIGADLKEIRKIIDKLIEKEGLSAGSEGKEEFTIEKKKKLEPKANRIGNLLNKNVIMKKCATLPEIVWGSYEVIKKGELPHKSLNIILKKIVASLEKLFSNYLITYHVRPAISSNFKTISLTNSIPETAVIIQGPINKNKN